MTECARDALLSADGVYRYRLTRLWSDGPTVTWVMLNPSTADALVDDPTIRRCIGFSKSWGFGSLLVVNLFALRSTDPKALLTHVDPVGEWNAAAVRTAIHDSSLVVAAWGAFKLSRTVPTVERDCAWYGVDLVCLGTTKDGSPRHPLYVRADQERVPWPPASDASLTLAKVDNGPDVSPRGVVDQPADKETR